MLHLRTEVRDKNGKIFKDAQGNPQPAFNTILDVGIKATMVIKAECKDLCRFMEAVSGSNRITVSVMVKNEISNTYMTMYSYYWSEKRFVEHN